VSHSLFCVLWVITTAHNLFCVLWVISTSHKARGLGTALKGPQLVQDRTLVGGPEGGKALLKLWGFLGITDIYLNDNFEPTTPFLSDQKNLMLLFVYKQERSNHMFSMNESNDEKKSSIWTGSIN
jgi:hypothetical protein